MRVRRGWRELVRVSQWSWSQLSERWLRWSGWAGRAVSKHFVCGDITITYHPSPPYHVQLIMSAFWPLQKSNGKLPHFNWTRMQMFIERNYKMLRFPCPRLNHHWEGPPPRMCCVHLTPDREGREGPAALTISPLIVAVSRNLDLWLITSQPGMSYTQTLR